MVVVTEARAASISGTEAERKSTSSVKGPCCDISIYSLIVQIISSLGLVGIDRLQ